MAPDRQRMKPETLQHLFVAAENPDLADPVLGIVVRRWCRGREQRAGSFLAAPEAPADAIKALPPAERFTWAERESFLTPVGRLKQGEERVIRESIDPWIAEHINERNQLITARRDEAAEAPGPDEDNFDDEIVPESDSEVDGEIPGGTED
jgi:hypothetical protein